ncbi:MAG: hypothetical protein GY715_21020 [Planctomycetes bacterium]|nr:hypothetical protein [Planctomycetota bacterium]
MLATSSFAQTPEADTAEAVVLPAPEWTGDLKAGVWLPRLDGDITLGGPSIDLADSLDIDDMEEAINLELTLRKNGRQLRINGFDFSTDKNAVYFSNATFGRVSLSPGDSYFSSVDFFSAGLELGFDLQTTTIDGKPMSEWREEETELRLTPRIGMRYVDYDQVLGETGVSVQDAGGEWLVPYVGMELLLRFEPAEGLILGRGVQLSAGTTVGPAIGGDNGFVWSVQATMALELVHNVSVMFGYRLLELDVENEGFELDGGLQGIFVGTVIRF